jgi:hypothetical protein
VVTGVEVEMSPWTKLVLAMTGAGAVALTVWIVSSAPDRTTTSDRTERAGAPAAEGARTSRPAKKPTAAKPSTENPAEVAAETPSPSTVIVPSYLVTQPRLADRAQPLLQRGADVQLAAEGFRTPELFMAVAHASRNLEVPFVVLKHRVLNERMTLSKAIAAARPDVNAAEHASQAMAAARADVFEANRGS